MAPLPSVAALLGLSAALFSQVAASESNSGSYAAGPEMVPDMVEHVDQDFMGYGARRQAFTADDFLIDLSQPFMTAPGGSIAVRTVDTTPVMGATRNTVTNTLYKLEPCGIITPHIHVGGTENIFVAKGAITAGFLEEPPFLRSIEKEVGEYQAFQVPQGLVHWLENKSCEPTVVHLSFPVSDPGTIIVSPSLFSMPDSILRASFPGLTEAELEELKEKALTAPSPALNGQCVNRCNNMKH